MPAGTIKQNGVESINNSRCKINPNFYNTNHLGTPISTTYNCNIGNIWFNGKEKTLIR